MAKPSYDLVIVGMGTAGIVAADFASRTGLAVAAVERNRVGGDCLWTGCVPSKALLASAKAADTMRHADRYGLAAVEPAIDTAQVFARIRSIQAEFAATDDNADRFAQAGVHMYSAPARLTSAHTLEVEGSGEISARYVLLCTGGRPAEPPIAGLASAGYMTSESIWDIERAPPSLLVIGGGPLSAEISQGLARLGVRVTLLHDGEQILPRDEPALAALLTEALRESGVEIVHGAKIDSVTLTGAMKVASGSVAGEPEQWRAEEILVGVGRQPNVEELGLARVGVRTGPQGIVVNAGMRTCVKSIYAAGDVTGRHLFTHSAGYEAAAAVRNMFFPGSEAAPQLVPWCTYTDPELAHAGMTEAEAKEAHGADRVRVWRHDLAHSDRARVESSAGGEIRIVTAKGRVVGAHALCPNAGELIHELALAIHDKKKLTDLASLVHVYPTLALGVGQLAGEASFERAKKLSFLVRSRA